jgi:hypothetical protein
VTLRALTIRQPWAHMIAHCGKDVENRSWPPPAGLGEFAIHAGARSGWDVAGEFSPVARRAWRNWVNAHPSWADILLRRDNPRIAFGAVIAVAELGDLTHSAIHATRCSCSPWSAAGQWHWELPGVRVLPSPVSCRGHLKLWTLPDDVEALVRAQLEESGNG